MKPLLAVWEFLVGDDFRGAALLATGVIITLITRNTSFAWVALPVAMVAALAVCTLNRPRV